MPVFRFLFSPHGRINRCAWWAVQSISILITLTIAAGAISISMTSSIAPERSYATAPLVSSLLIFFLPPFIWISFAASAKRFHDRGKSGYWHISGIVPIAGPLWQFVELGFQPGDEAENRFGKPLGLPAFVQTQIVRSSPFASDGSMVTAVSGAPNTPTPQAELAQPKTVQKFVRPENRAAFGLRAA